MADPLAIDLISPVQFYVGWALTLLSLVLELFVFVHCLFQKREAFPAIGTLSKGLWLVIMAAGVAISAITVMMGMTPIIVFELIGLTAATVYILDVRPGLRELNNNGGTSW